MRNLYFECKSGISGDMSVAALLDLGASKEKLEKALSSMGLNDEFKYVISKKPINAIMATDFDVILPHHHVHEACSPTKDAELALEHGHSVHNLSADQMHLPPNGNCSSTNEAELALEHRHGVYNLSADQIHLPPHHEHRNLDDVNTIIDKADTTESAKNLAKKIFKIVAEAEAKVHGKDIKDVHFHEVGAIDSIVDIVSFAVLFDDLSPEKVYFSALTDGQGFVECQHGRIPVPVPAVCEIASAYKLPIKISDNEGEMVTPTGAAIVAALYTGEKLSQELIIEKVGYGAGKRPYANPILRVMSISDN